MNIDFFTLKDKRVLINLYGKTPKLDTTLHFQTSLETLCYHILNEVKKRNFEIDGIDIDFLYKQEKKSEKNINDIIEISSISGENFRISFSQKRLDFIQIPKKEISLYRDTGDVDLTIYVGDKWEEDKERFYYKVKTNSKLNNEKKWYLKYSTSTHKNISTNGKHGKEEDFHNLIQREIKIKKIFNDYKVNFQDEIRNIYFLPDNDLNREYTPEGDELDFYYTDDIFYIFYKWLEKNVYNKIKKLDRPPKKPIKEIFKEPEKIKIDNNILDKLNPIYTVVDNLIDYENYGCIFPSYRLLYLGDRIKKKDSKYYDIVNDGFIWSYNKEDKILNQKSKHIFKLHLKHANEVYVINSKNIDQHERAKSIIFINDYKGEYKNPMVIIRRKLLKDEIELIK